MPPTNNITRFLDSKKIIYTSFELPSEKLGARATAQLLNVPPVIVYKSIVSLRERPGKHILAVIPGTRELDLKALALSIGEKKVYLATLREAEKVTGLKVGGISPLALINKGFQIVIDEQAKNYEQIHISGGQRGLNLRMRVSDLAALTHARFAPVSLESNIADDLE